MIRFANLFSAALLLTLWLAPLSAQSPHTARTVEPVDPIAAPPDELKIEIMPLDLKTLEPIRDAVLAALRTQANELAALLVQHQRLTKTPDAPDDEVQTVEEQLTELIDAKAELVSRANIILAAMEAKGGDVAADRAYVAVIDGMRIEDRKPTAAADALSPEEQTKAAVRGRVAELVAIVRAEPPVHERPKPWEVPISEFELELQPLTLAQIEERLTKWQDILQHEVRKRVRYDILLNSADKLGNTQSARDEAARLAGIAPEKVEGISLDALKAELAQQSQAQQQIVRAIVERMNIAIRLVQKRGGDPKSYVDYIASATGQKLNLYDPSVLGAQVRAWLFARDGGIKIGLNVLKFIGVLVAFWVLSVILGWIANAAINRIPQTSSLLRPLVVIGVRRTAQIVGVIIAITMLGVNAGPLLAMIGAAGLVIGLALQSTLSNFASGIMILVNRPYDVGDVIDAGGVLGKVEAMNLVSTRVVTFDNQIMLVPNNQIWNGVITNITGRDTRRVDLTFGIAYSDDIAKAMKLLEDTLTAHPKVLKDPAPVVRVHELADNSVNLIARPWVRTTDYWDVYWDLMRDVKLRFDADGVNIPFPQRDLHIPGAIEVTLSERRRGNGSGSTKPALVAPKNATPTHEPAHSTNDDNGGS